MKPSAEADHSSNLTSCNRRAVLGGIAGSIAAPALIASTGVFANNATRGVSLAAADSDNTHELTHREVSLNGLRFHIAESGQGRWCCSATAFQNVGTPGGINWWRLQKQGFTPSPLT
jgi:hypothetical protein